MIPFAGLGLIVFVLGAAAGPLLIRSGWCQRIPKVAVLAWLGILAGTLAAMVGMVAVVSTGRHGLIHRGVEWLADCWHHHEGANDPASYVLNALLLVGALAVTGGSRGPIPAYGHARASTPGGSAIRRSGLW